MQVTCSGAPGRGGGAVTGRSGAVQTAERVGGRPARPGTRQKPPWTAAHSAGRRGLRTGRPEARPQGRSCRQGAQGTWTPGGIRRKADGRPVHSCPPEDPAQSCPPQACAHTGRPLRLRRLSSHRHAGRPWQHPDLCPGLLPVLCGTCQLLFPSSALAPVRPQAQPQRQTNSPGCRSLAQHDP